MGASLSEFWAPGFIGATVATALYGVSIGQFIFYVQAFPHDTVRLKLMVFIVFFIDNVQSISVMSGYYHLLVACHSSVLPTCTVDIPGSFIVSMFTVYCATFMVQSFYAHRVWIISNGNRFITCAVLVFALGQLVLGLLCMALVIHTPSFYVLSTTQLSPLSAISSAVCDAIITGSICYYLRPARTGVSRQGNYIRKLNLVFIQMGLLSLINASALAIMYYIQVNGVPQLLSAAPGAVLCKTYVNSMLSVLNARKPIREEREAQARRSIEIPTIPTIL